MRFEQFLLGILFGGLILFIGFAALTSIIAEYEVTDANTSSFAGIHNKLADIRGSQDDDIEANILAEGVTEGAVEDVMFKGGFETVRDLYDTTTVFANVSEIVVQEVAFADEHTPSLFPTIKNTVLVGVGVLLLFSVVYLVFRFMPR